MTMIWFRVCQSSGLEWYCRRGGREVVEKMPEKAHYCDGEDAELTDKQCKEQEWQNCNSISCAVYYIFYIINCQKHNLVINFLKQCRTKMTVLFFISQLFPKASNSSCILNNYFYLGWSLWKVIIWKLPKSSTKFAGLYHMFTSSTTWSDTMMLWRINAVKFLLAVSFKLQILIGWDTNFHKIFKFPKALWISFHTASCHVVNLVSFLVNGVFIPLTNLKKNHVYPINEDKHFVKLLTYNGEWYNTRWKLFLFEWTVQKAFLKWWQFKYCFVIKGACVSIQSMPKTMW